MEFPAETVRSYNGIEVVKAVDLVAGENYLKAGTYTVTVAKGVQTYYGTVCRQMGSQFVVAKGEASEISYHVAVPDNVLVEKNGELLSDEISVSPNDILKITAQTSDKLALVSLRVNGEPFTSGDTYTVAEADVVIEAEFETILSYFTVDFDSRGGSVVESQEVVEGKKVVKPADPLMVGSTLLGWYLDAGYQTEWNFETDTVSGNITLYAKWSDEGNLPVEKQEQQIIGTDSYVKTMGDAAFKLDAVSSAGTALSYESSDTTIAAISEDGTVTLIGVGSVQITVIAPETNQYKAAEKMISLVIQQKPNPTPGEDEKPDPTPGGSDTPGTNPGTTPGGSDTPGTNPGTTPGGSDNPGANPGTAPGGSDTPGTDPGTNPGTTDSGNNGKVDPATCVHKFGSWKETAEATALREGSREAVCSICGTVRREPVPKLKGYVKLNIANNTSVPLKIKQTTKAIKVVEYQKGDRVKSWSSSNKKVATVSSGGKIKGKKKGTAVITVTMESGVTAKFKVKVQKGTVKAKKIVLIKKKLSLKKGKSASLLYKVTPITCAQKVKFITSNKKVATVSSKGVIKAKKAGKVKITLKIGTKKAVCTVTVK